MRNGVLCTKMSSPTVNDHILNSLLAGFLISSLPVAEQLIPRQWLHRLNHIPDTCQGEETANSACEEERIKRDILLRNFLIGLLKSELPDTFKEPPPTGCLPESEDVLLTLGTPSTQWAIELEATNLPDNVDQPSSSKFSTPSEFLSKQPIPCNGAFCYGGVFSQPAPKIKFLNN